MATIKHEDNPKSIKFYVKRYLLENASFFKGKKIVDFPAGNGVTTAIIKNIGAEPYAYDLFPEYFELKDIECKKADIKTGIPLENNFADALICQEGIEHFSDQIEPLKEFNRILKKEGILLITTPNYSNLRAKMSYFLAESERYNTFMAPNELDSIWMSKNENMNEIYYGHIFLIGIQKLRVLAKLSGFKIKKFHFTRLKTTSVIMFPFWFPFIYFANLIAYKKNMRKNKEVDYQTKKEVYGEIFRLAINPKILVSHSLMVEFTKEKEVHEVATGLKSQHKSFGTT